jgi:hypothetical protein
MTLDSEGGPRAPAAAPRGGAALAVPLPSRPPNKQWHIHYTQRAQLKPLGAWVHQ